MTIIFCSIPKTEDKTVMISQLYFWTTYHDKRRSTIIDRYFLSEMRSGSSCSIWIRFTSWQPESPPNCLRTAFVDRGPIRWRNFWEQTRTERTPSFANNMRQRCYNWALSAFICYTHSSHVKRVRIWLKICTANVLWSTNDVEGNVSRRISHTSELNWLWGCS